MMLRLIATFLALVLVPTTVPACSHMQADGRALTESSNEASNDTSKTPSGANGKTLFKGANLTVIEDDQALLNEVTVKEPGRSCLAIADSIIKPKLSALYPDNNTSYFDLESKQSYNPGPEKFVVKVRRDLFEKTNSESWAKIDEYVGFTVTRKLFLLRSSGVDAFLFIGSESATSGLGHLSKLHLLSPLASYGPDISFRSMSDDPRRVGISSSGAIYFSQIESPHFEDVEEPTDKTLRLTVSLMSVGRGGKLPSLEAELNFTCSNVNEMFSE